MPLKSQLCDVTKVCFEYNNPHTYMKAYMKVHISCPKNKELLAFYQLSLKVRVLFRVGILSWMISHQGKKRRSQTDLRCARHCIFFVYSWQLKNSFIIQWVLFKVHNKALKPRTLPVSHVFFCFIASSSVNKIHR